MKKYLFLKKLQGLLESTWDGVMFFVTSQACNLVLGLQFY